MQTSVQGEVVWRLDLYQRIFTICRQGGFSFERFIALVPDRLRLAIGESVGRIRVPIAVSDGLESLLSSHLPGQPILRTGPLYDSPQGLRRLLRWAQTDHNSDIVGLGRWMQSSHTPLFDAATATYLKGFEEIGRGEGGEETAYLAHLALIDAIRRAQKTKPEMQGVGPTTLAVSIVDHALRSIMESGAVREPSLKLGLQFAATLSPMAFGLNPVDAMSIYRTNEAALSLARRVIQSPVEAIDVNQVRDVIAERLLLDLKVGLTLVVDTYADMLRDCLLLLTAQEVMQAHDSEVERVAEICRSSNALRHHILNANRRHALATLLASNRFVRSQASAAARRLLEVGDNVLAGDLSALGAHGDITTRAKVAAAGAVGLVLDEHTAKQQEKIRAIFDYVPKGEQDQEYERGRCYLLSEDRRPLYLLAVQNKCGHLVVSFRGLTSILLERDARSAADFLQRYLYGPILKCIEGAGAPNGVAISRLDESGVALRGDLFTLLEIGQLIQTAVAKADSADQVENGDVLGVDGLMLSDVVGEIDRVDMKLSLIVDKMRTIADGPRSSLDEQKVMLDEQRRDLVKMRGAIEKRSRGRRLFAGAFLAFGDTGERIDLSERDATVLATRALFEANLGVGLSRRIDFEQSQLCEYYERTTGTRAELPYRVTVREYDIGQGRTFAEINNEGLAISGAALDAFRRERNGILELEDIALSTFDLGPEVRRRFVLEGATDRFVVGRRVWDGEIVVIFHLSGELGLGNGNNPQPLPVWEVLDRNSPFARILTQALGKRNG